MMKTKNLLFSFLVTLFFIQLASAQIYVKHDAAGSNNGTSWANAYTDLQTAFNGAQEGSQVWVAAGTYTPVILGDTVEAFFSFFKDLEVYGGFVGTETTLSERDWMTNETILSGDHLGNDAPGNFEMFRGDNSKHVMWFTDTLTVATILDGLTISHGNTEGSTSADDNRRAGGILTYSSITVRNCLFTQNYGYFAGGLYLRGNSDVPNVITNCRFIQNNAFQGAGIYMNSPAAVITDCAFNMNISNSLGASIYNNTSDGSIIRDCTFTQNTSLDSRAGGIYCRNTPTRIVACTFDRNRAAASTGAAIHIRNADDETRVVTVNVDSCIFERNESNWGGAVGVYDRFAAGNFTNCTFNLNSANVSGGSSTNGFGATSTFRNCTFTQNSADQGGAIYNQNDSSTINIIDCLFDQNEAVARGGAIHVAGDNEPTNGQPIPQLNIMRSTFFSNTALEQAGAINLSNANISVDNSLFALNFVINTDGIGGAISLNTSDTIETVYSIINSTFTLNTADIGAGISNWLADETGTTTLTVQNTIFNNPDGDNYVIEAGMPTIVSAGGNLSSDNSLLTIFTNTDDLNNTAPGFIDPYGDFRLMDLSPCVNTGINAGASATDLDGNPRLGRVDKGAYENQNVVGVHNALTQNFGSLEVFPIPAVNTITFSIENNWKGNINAEIVDTKGRVVLIQTFDKSSPVLQQELNIEELNQGVYFLRISNGVNISVRHIVK